MIDRFNGEYEFLSNFYYAPVSFAGLHFPTNEHAFQAMKVFGYDARYAIACADTPNDAKRLGRHVKLRKDWENIKLNVMHDITGAKYIQNPELGQKLIDTGDEELVEGNTWHDTIWGVCYCAKHNGYGQNHLGSTLMLVRSELRGDD